MTDGVFLGRIVNEDDDFVLIEVAKSPTTKRIQIEDGDRFVTLQFPKGPPWHGGDQ